MSRVLSVTFTSMNTGLYSLADSARCLHGRALSARSIPTSHRFARRSSSAGKCGGGQEQRFQVLEAGLERFSYATPRHSYRYTVLVRRYRAWGVGVCRASFSVQPDCHANVLV